MMDRELETRRQNITMTSTNGGGDGKSVLKIHGEPIQIKQTTRTCDIYKEVHLINFKFSILALFREFL